METRYGVPVTIPQFKDGKLVQVPFVPEQFPHVTLSRAESVEAVISFRRKFKKNGKLTVEEIKEALRQGRETKHFDHCNTAYFQKVNKKHFRSV